MEYDELDDVVQYHKYLLLMDNNHICKFLILEPKRKRVFFEGKFIDEKYR